MAKLGEIVTDKDTGIKYQAVWEERREKCDGCAFEFSKWQMCLNVDCEEFIYKELKDKDNG